MYPLTHTHTLQARTAAERLYGADHFVTLEAADMLADSQLEVAHRQKQTDYDC